MNSLLLEETKPSPFEEADQQAYRIRQLERQVSDLYEKLSQLATSFEMMVKFVNGKPPV